MPSPPSPVNEHPEPEKGSGQKNGELWKNFFSRMEKLQEEAIQWEDSWTKMVRLSREAAQKAHPVPGLGSKAPKVYEWGDNIPLMFQHSNKHLEKGNRQYSDDQRGPVEIEQDIPKVPTHEEGVVADNHMADGEKVEAIEMEEAASGIPTELGEIRAEGC
jgi:hypothetical protein